MPRHCKKTPILPPWAKATADDCLRSVAEDAYTAKALAEEYGAGQVPACQQLLRAAAKSIKQLANPKARTASRCAAGDRAARKFWEAKVCARTHGQTRAGLGGHRKKSRCS